MTLRSANERQRCGNGLSHTPASEAPVYGQSAVTRM